jgi:anti-sigma28 factor (negative regulator of flagellin synthesis)
MSKKSEPNGKVIFGPAEHALADTQMQLKHLLAHLDAARSDSPARLGKLRHLRAAVSSGGYHVDADVVSSRIIEGGLGFDGESGK